MFHGSTQPNTDFRLEATIGIRLAATIAGQDGAPVTVETVLALAVARVAILDQAGEIIEASTLIRRDLGEPSGAALVAVSPQDLLRPALLAPSVGGEILTEWQSIAAAARQGSRALMAYQILGGHRHRLLFIPLTARGDAHTRPPDSPSDAANAAGLPQMDGLVAIVACHTLHADGELLDAEMEYRECDYATLGELECLSVRELDALRMLGIGFRTAKLSRPLHCAARQVGTVLKNLRSKLCASDNFKLAVLAIRSGLIDIDDKQWQRTVFVRTS